MVVILITNLNRRFVNEMESNNSGISSNSITSKGWLAVFLRFINIPMAESAPEDVWPVSASWPKCWNYPICLTLRSSTTNTKLQLVNFNLDSLSQLRIKELMFAHTRMWQKKTKLRLTFKFFTPNSDPYGCPKNSLNNMTNNSEYFRNNSLSLYGPGGG